MNKIKYIAAVLIAIAGLGFQQAQADLGPVTYFLTPHPIGSPTDDTNFLIANFGQESDLTSLFKLNSDGTTAGSFGSFFTITVISASDWMVSWNLTGSGFTLESILIKDGSPAHSGGQQLYGFYPVINNEGT